MKQELQNRLFAKYPRLYQDRNKDMTQTAMCWGIECGDGWYTLLDCLSSVIEEHVENETLNNPTKEHYPVASQVKEKYGGLRFYTTTCDPYIDGAIRVAEKLSYSICEMCGKPGILNKHGWMRTLCEECREK